MSDTASRVLAVPLARLFAPPLPGPLPDGPPPEELRAAELEAACAAAREEAHAALAPRIRQLEGDLAAERAARTAEAAEQIAIAGAAISALQASLADAVASLALAIARQVLAAESALAQATLATLVAQALEQAPEGDCGTLRVHPLHLAAAPAPPSGWRLMPDPDLQPGAVIAEAGPWLALASLELRLEQARDALEGQP
jgi:flagellar biosynthesis/type III secretory pathway protein FliH